MTACVDLCDGFEMSTMEQPNTNNVGIKQHLSACRSQLSLPESDDDTPRAYKKWAAGAAGKGAAGTRAAGA